MRPKTYCIRYLIGFQPEDCVHIRAMTAEEAMFRSGIHPNYITNISEVDENEE